MEKVCVSVVVPVYNVIHYLDECLRSLINQTLQNIEIILVDDGSTDGSDAVCDAYAEKDERIQVIHKANGGLGSARNIGLSAAKGEYVYFIDSDDSLKQNALEALYDRSYKDNLDVLLFSAECFSDEIGINYNANEYKRTGYLKEINSGKDLFIKLLDIDEYYASVPLRLYKTEYLKAKQYIFPEHIIHEDEIYAYWSLIQAERAECVADRFYNRRFRAGSIMTSKRAYNSSVGYVYTWKEIINSLDELTGWTDELVLKVVRFAYFRLNIALNYYALTFDADDRKKFSKEIADIKDTIKKNPIALKTSKRLRLFYKSAFLFRTYMRLENQKTHWKTPYVEYKKKQAFYAAVEIIKRGNLENKTYAILIGTPTHGNLGDQAIVYAENKMVKAIHGIDGVVEISSTQYLKYADILQQSIPSRDIIIIDGGGSMGTLWVNNEYRFRDVIRRFPNNRVYIFPQTVFFGDNEWETKVLEDSKKVYDAHKKLTIFCRDRLSYEFVKNTFANNKVVYAPDMVLSLYPLEVCAKRSDKVLVCFRDDVEAVVGEDSRKEIICMLEAMNYKIGKISTVINKYVDNSNRESELYQKWNEFASAGLVITDRLHAMIFCALTGTPCIALNNRSRKVEGTYDWISEIPYICMLNMPFDINKESIDELMAKADKFIKLDNITACYNEMRELIESNERNYK